MQDYAIEQRMLHVDEVKPADYNPRRISSEELEQLKHSIREHGFTEAITVNKAMTIIGGHQRIKAAKELGITHVPAVVVDIPKDRERTLNIALNKIKGEFDEEKLRQMLAAMTDEERLRTGFDAAELTKQLDALINPKEDDYDPDSAPKTYRAQQGDVFQLGEHRLMCGDSTNPEHVAKLMNGERAAMVFTDPPYNIAYEGGMSTDGQNKREMIMNDKMSSAEFFDFLAKVMKNLIDWCDGAMYVCMSSSELVNLKAAFEQGGGALSELYHLG